MKAAFFLQNISKHPEKCTVSCLRVDEWLNKLINKWMMNAFHENHVYRINANW
jgi:hypothetical protein